MTERSPSASRFTTARSERPISRWISWVRPLARPFVTSRGVRVPVARGSIAYSAVTQPLPEFRRNAGTEFSTLAAHNTCVLPTVMSAEPSAVFRYPGTIVTARSSFVCLESARIFHREVHSKHCEYAHHNDNYQARNTLPHLWWKVLLFLDRLIFCHSVSVDETRRLLRYGT